MVNVVNRADTACVWERERNISCVILKERERACQNSKDENCVAHRDHQFFSFSISLWSLRFSEQQNMGKTRLAKTNHFFKTNKYFSVRGFKILTRVLPFNKLRLSKNKSFILLKVKSSNVNGNCFAIQYRVYSCESSQHSGLTSQFFNSNSKAAP